MNRLECTCSNCRWIPISEGLPDNGQIVDVVWGGCRVCDVAFSQDPSGDYFAPMNGDMGLSVTVVRHWRPIGSLPAEA